MKDFGISIEGGGERGGPIFIFILMGYLSLESLKNRKWHNDVHVVGNGFILSIQIW